jgi:tetratricopeptide (TPR) repeat protein
METDHPETKEQELIEQVRKLPLRQAPADLSDRVMARIASKRPNLVSTVWNFISLPRTTSFRPIYAFSIALLIGGSFLLGRFLQPDPVQIAVSPDLAAPLQPEKLKDPQSAYLVGRGLLQADNSETLALAFLRRAALLDPRNPEFAYWEGVGHWANGDKEGERRSYMRGLGEDPESLPLLINLGHSYLSDRKYREALDAYQAALDLAPDDPVARYNSGLIYRAQNRVAEEIGAWRAFLQDNRIGAKPFRAVKRLHDYRDFSFRIYRVGPRKLIINQRALLDESLPDEIRKKELAPLVSILEQDEQLRLEVVVFIQHDREAARQRAFAIKKMIKEMGGADLGKRIGMSWFDTPETIMVEDGAGAVELPEGLLMFGRPKIKQEKEVSI